MLEKDLENKFRHAVRHAGGRAFKFVSPGTRGVPDRLVLLPGGRVGFIELKRKGRVPTKLQRLQRTRIKELGFYCEILDDVKDIDRVIKEISQHEI